VERDTARRCVSMYCLQTSKANIILKKHVNYVCVCVCVLVRVYVSAGVSAREECTHVGACVCQCVRECVWERAL